MSPELKKIVKSIQKWDAVRKTNSEALTYLQQGNCFCFDGMDKGTSTTLHAYCGITDSKLVFYLIPSEFDTPETQQEVILNKIITCPVQRIVGESPEIPEEEAKRRIKYWKADLEEWLPQQISSEFGLFEAFAIPVADVMGSDGNANTLLKYTAYFALEKSPSAAGYSADLVLLDNHDNVFYDTVRPVPPFPPKDGIFYLLDIQP